MKNDKVIEIQQNGKVLTYKNDPKLGPKGKATVKRETTDAKQIIDKVREETAAIVGESATTPEPAKKGEKKKAVEKKAPRKKIEYAIPESETLELNEDNFLAVMKKLGGKDVSTAAMLPISRSAKIQIRSTDGPDCASWRRSWQRWNLRSSRSCGTKTRNTGLHCHRAHTCSLFFSIFVAVELYNQKVLSV